MASFDPSIISQIPDMAGNPYEARLKAYKLADLMTQEQSNKLTLAHQKEQEDEYQKTKNIMKGADLSTNEGRVALSQKLSQAGLAKPAMEALTFSGEQQSRDLQQAAQRMQVLKLATDEIGPTAKKLLDQSITQGPQGASLNPQGYAQARAAYQQELARVLPMLPPELRNKLPPELPADPRQGIPMLQKAIANSEQARQMIAQENKQKDEARADKRLDLAQQSSDRAEKREQRAEETAKQNAGSEADLEANAKAIASYQEGPPTLSSRNPRGYKLMARVMELNPEYDANLYKTRGATERAFATGKQGDTVRSLNVAIQHLNLLSDLSKDLNNKDVRTVNKFYNAIGREFGKTDITNFETAKPIVGDEIVKSVIGSGAGSLTDREDLQKKFDAAATPEQLAGVIKTAKGLMSGQLKGLKQQYESGSGRTDFESKISPETKAELEGGSDSKQAPAVGTVLKGYRFKGGDPADKANWEKTGG